MNKDQIAIYQAPDGKTSVEVKLIQETVWLSQEQMGNCLTSQKKPLMNILKIFTKRMNSQKKIQKGNSEIPNFLTNRPITTI